MRSADMETEPRLSIACAITGQGIVNLGCGGIELFGVGKSVSLVREFFFLARLELGGGDFIGLELIEVQHTGALAFVGLQAVALGEDVGQLDIQAMGLLAEPGDIRAAPGIEDVDVDRDAEKRLMLVLAVDVDHPRSDFFLDGGGGRAAVDATLGPAAPRDFAAEDQKPFFGIEAVFGRDIGGGLVVRDVENGLDHGFIGPGADHLAAGALAQGHAHGIDNDRLARAGLTREHVEPRPDLEPQVIDQGEVLNMEFG